MAALGGLIPGSSRADVITTGCANPPTCQMNELTGGGTIQVDDKVFTAFRFSPTGSDPAPNPARITVSGTGVGTLEPGLRFSSADQFAVGANQGQNFIIQFVVSIAPGSPMRITDLLFDLNPPIVVNGTASISGLEVANCTGDTGLQPRRELNVTPARPSDRQDTAAPATSCEVFKQLVLGGGSNGNAQLTSFDNQFSQTRVPEPGSLALLGSALLFGGVFAGRRRRA